MIEKLKKTLKRKRKSSEFWHADEIKKEISRLESLIRDHAIGLQNVYGELKLEIQNLSKSEKNTKTKSIVKQITGFTCPDCKVTVPVYIFSEE